MNTPGENEIWTPPRLRARLAAQKGLAPAPSCYVVWRTTTRSGGAEAKGYELPNEKGRRNEAAFERWLLERNLAGAERLSVSVLVIREQLDVAGLIDACVLERRRGGVDGPYYGNVARVEFTGAANMVRRYRASADGRLTELPAEDATGVSPPPASVTAESFSGEDAAVHQFLGPGAVILDRRSPTLFEDLVGLSGVVHARRPDGAEVACGVGWHGDIAFVLAADFPRFGLPLSPPPELEAAVRNAVRTRDLVPYETRLDEHGFRVIARERGRPTLVAIRREGRATRIDPYVPGRVASANDDQRRWMTYAETYEARTILDSWRDGDSDNVVVLTIDPEQEAWRHVIDTDGVELSRQTANDTAAAAIYRESLSPPDEALASPAAQPTATAAPIATRTSAAPDDEAPADSLLSKALAWSRVTALLSEAAGAGTTDDVRDRLRAMLEPLGVLRAEFTLGSLRRLIARTEAGNLSGGDLTAALDAIAARLRDELALSQVVTVPPAEVGRDGEPPFGGKVELHFPAAAYDIEEATRCVALRRSTAAVLHAARVLQHGLAGLEGLLATPGVTASSWTRLIATMRGVPAEYRDLADALVRLRRAWRAPGLTPAAKYTEEEAEAVVTAVGSFMQLLADHLEANGATPDD